MRPCAGLHVLEMLLPTCQDVALADRQLAMMPHLAPEDLDSQVPPPEVEEQPPLYDSGASIDDSGGRRASKPSQRQRAQQLMRDPNFDELRAQRNRLPVTLHNPEDIGDVGHVYLSSYFVWQPVEPGHLDWSSDFVCRPVEPGR